jgi:hypothetical protein
MSNNADELSFFNSKMNPFKDNGLPACPKGVGLPKAINA